VRSHYAERFRQWGYDLPADLRTRRRGVIPYAAVHRTAYLYRHLRRRHHAVEGVYLAVFGKTISLNARVNRRLAMLEQGTSREDVLAKLRKEMDQHKGAVRDPALFADRRQGAEGQHRLHPGTADAGDGRTDGRPSSRSRS
jgi:hypothetical protein